MITHQEGPFFEAQWAFSTIFCVYPSRLQRPKYGGREQRCGASESQRSLGHTLRNRGNFARSRVKRVATRGAACSAQGPRLALLFVVFRCPLVALLVIRPRSRWRLVAHLLLGVARILCNHPSQHNRHLAGRSPHWPNLETPWLRHDPPSLPPLTTISTQITCQLFHTKIRRQLMVTIHPRKARSIFKSSCDVEDVLREKYKRTPRSSSKPGEHEEMISQLRRQYLLQTSELSPSLLLAHIPSTWSLVQRRIRHSSTMMLLVRCWMKCCRGIIARYLHTVRRVRVKRESTVTFSLWLLADRVSAIPCKAT